MDDIDFSVTYQVDADAFLPVFLVDNPRVVAQNIKSTMVSHGLFDSPW
jgi:hypothetical protein